MHNPLYVRQAANDLKFAYKEQRAMAVPELQLIVTAGSAGLKNIESQLKNSITIPFSSMRNWPLGAIKGHGEHVTIGELYGKNTAVLTGRIHNYQGFTYEQISFAYAVLRKFTSKKKSTPPILLSTHAVGAVNPVQQQIGNVGDILISESMFYLYDPNRPGTGGPFIPCTNQLDIYLRMLLVKTAENMHPQGYRIITQGTTVVLPGPKFETPAEIEHIRRYLLAGDLIVVGMSGNELQYAASAGYSAADLGGITNLTVCLTEIRERLKQVDQDTLTELLASGMSIWEAKKKMPVLKKIIRGPDHKEVLANQALVGGHLEELITQVANDYNF